MRSEFPEKRAGDKLGAGHVNALSRVCRRVDAGGFGSHSHGFFGEFHGGIPANLATIIEVVVTTPLTISSLGGTTPSIHEAQLRYYDHDAGEWKKDEDRGSWELDPAGNTYEVDDVVTVYWHAQRRAFIPMAAKTSQVLKIGKAVAEIEPDATGQIRLWKNGEEVSGDEGLLTVSHDWITENLAIEKDSEVIAGWFADENLWRIIGAACPTV